MKWPLPQAGSGTTLRRLNLTAANHVFHFDRWWNPAVENQATDRAFRIGQTRRVQVHKFDCIIGSRLARGRSYARKGQVLAIAIENGKVTAKVQGSRPRPYVVSIAVKTLTKAEWSKVLDALGRQALLAAKLLAGEMPQEIEEVFTEVGLSLFPAKLGDLKTDCSCPDWSNPCKHIAAVYYLLGEEFDRDPFLIFALRGLDRDALTSRLGATPPEPAAASRPAEPLSAQVETFWGESGVRIEDSLGAVEIPRSPAALPRRLGGFPFWRGETPFLDALSPIYAAASPRGLDVLLGPASQAERSEAE